MMYTEEVRPFVVGRTVPLPLKVIVEKTVERFEAGPTRAVGDEWGLSALRMGQGSAPTAPTPTVFIALGSVLQNQFSKFAVREVNGWG